MEQVLSEEKAKLLFESATSSENRGCLDWVDFESILWRLMDLAACSVRWYNCSLLVYALTRCGSAHEVPSNVKFLPAKIQQVSVTSVNNALPACVVICVSGWQLRRIIHAHTDPRARWIGIASAWQPRCRGVNQDAGAVKMQRQCLNPKLAVLFQVAQ